LINPEIPRGAERPTIEQVAIDCLDMTSRLVNESVRQAIASGARTIRLLRPAARHNLGVALREGIRLVVEGSAGHYVGGLNDGGMIDVEGSAGWGAAESMRDGTVVITGDAGNAVAASIRGGTVVVRGGASTRAGIAMKGGVLLIAGNVGPTAGFMMQKGIIVVCGDAGDGVADSMYAGTVYVGGRTGELGADAIETELTPHDRELVHGLLDSWRLTAPARIRKLVSGRKLWNFQSTDRAIWKAAL
jgi:glutamate synthase domain-containing protein 3